MRSSVVTSLICSSAQLYGALDWDLSSVFCRQPTLSLSLLTGWQIPLGHYISRLVERQKKKNPWRFNQLSGPVRLFYHPLWRYWFCSRLPQVLSGTVFLLFYGSSWEPTFRFWTNLFLCQNVPKCSRLGEQTTTDLAPCLWQRNPQIYTNTTCSQSVEKKRTEQQSGTAKKLL